MEDREYSVSEAVRLTGVPSHVLRYWEEELQIAIKRTSQGHRIYSEANLNLFRQVKEWKEKGIQLKAIRVLLGKGEPDSRLAKEVWEIDHAGERKTETRGGAERSWRNGQTGESLPQDGDRMGVSEKEHASLDENENGDSKQEIVSSYEVVLAEDKPDNLKQFEMILKQMIEEVMAEQSEKLEQALIISLREEIEELYMQYVQTAMQEAAAAKMQEKREHILKRLWRVLTGKRTE